MNGGQQGYIRTKEFDERVYHIKRVSKKTTGGNAIGFTALAIVGDKKGKIGAALGKSRDVSKAIQKAISKAKDNVVSVNLRENTIPHEVSNKYAAAKVLLKPAPKGSGIIAGGPVRVVLELAGVKDVSAKMLGSSNKLANVRCTIEALEKLKRKLVMKKITPKDFSIIYNNIICLLAYNKFSLLTYNNSYIKLNWFLTTDPINLFLLECS